MKIRSMFLVSMILLAGCSNAPTSTGLNVTRAELEEKVREAMIQQCVMRLQKHYDDIGMKPFVGPRMTCKHQFD
jgi:hypothetical protein